MTGRFDPAHEIGLALVMGKLRMAFNQIKRRRLVGKKIIAAGHICLDITPVFPEQKVENIGDIMVPGKLIQMGGADVHTGGAVANTGLAMKVLGADVTLMGKIGADEFGGMVQNILRRYGVDEGMIVSGEASTSYSVVIAIPGIDRVFLHNPGANDSFGSEDIDYAEAGKADLFHFGYPSLMRRMYQEGGKELAEMFRRMKERHVATSLDLAAVDAKSEAGRADWNDILSRTLPYVDFFVPSVEELCFMIDRERYEIWNKRAAGRDITEVISLEEVRPLSDRAVSMGAGAVLIKCGAPGIYYRTASAERMKPVCERLGLVVDEWADKEGFERSFVPEQILSGTGAGDTSIAAFLVSALGGAGLEKAVRLATATGACCVAAYDALSGLKPLAELKEKIEKGWAKNEFAGW